MTPHIQIRNLTVSYGSHQALRDITFAIPRNRITVIMGPSGCGKSTLLKSLNRLLEVGGDARVSGTVLIDGVDVYASSIDVTEVRKKTGLLSQHPYPLPMSIFDNVAFGPRIHRMVPRKELRDTVRHYLEMAGLWDEVKDRLGAPASALSVGQQQRLCLARCLAVEPEIILADEATSALDPLSARHIEQRLIELKERYTVVLVTHILRQAKRLADYVIFLYLGDLVEAGPAEAVFTRPRSPLTQAYVSGQSW